MEKSLKEPSDRKTDTPAPLCLGENTPPALIPVVLRFFCPQASAENTKASSRTADMKVKDFGTRIIVYANI